MADNDTSKQPTILEKVYAHRRKGVEVAQASPEPQSDELDKLVIDDTRLIMAEIKRASPFKGDIALFVNPAQQPLLYGQAGASVISALTDPTWYKGSLLDMRLVCCTIDTVRRFSEYQIAEARLWGTDRVTPPRGLLEQERGSGVVNELRVLERVGSVKGTLVALDPSKDLGVVLVNLTIRWYENGASEALCRVGEDLVRVDELDESIPVVNALQEIEGVTVLLIVVMLVQEPLQPLLGCPHCRFDWHTFDSSV